MAKAVTARRQGDEFQALFFWNQLIRLLTEDNIKSVTFEHYKPMFVDDVVVEYSERILEDHTGRNTQTDFFQCKYHVSQDKVFSVDHLIDPKFIHSKESMIERLYSAYTEFKTIDKDFRLYVVSSSGWDTSDFMYKYVSPEGSVRDSFYVGGENSKQGKIRTRLMNHLKISAEKLKPFLDSVRFDLAINRTQMLEKLNLGLKLAGLEPINQSITDTRYASLAWKWLEQGANSFDKQKLEHLVRKEKLIDTHRKSLLLIRHQSLDPIMPDTVHDDLTDNLRNMAFTEIAIDLTHLFSDGRLTDPQLAINEQQERTNEIRQLYKNSPNLELAYYGIAHIPLVFLLGYQLNFRRPVNIFEHDRGNNKWNLLQTTTTFPDLIVQSTSNDASNIGTEVIIKFGVSYPIIDSDVNQIVPMSSSTMKLTLQSPTPDAVRNLEQLETYALMFRAALDEIHNLSTNIDRVHVFYASPVSLAFRCGQMISPTIHPKVLVYNYFSQDNPKYKWGIHVNTPLTSPDFLVEL